MKKNQTAKTLHAHVAFLEIDFVPGRIRLWHYYKQKNPRHVLFSYSHRWIIILLKFNIKMLLAYFMLVYTQWILLRSRPDGNKTSNSRDVHIFTPSRAHERRHTCLVIGFYFVFFNGSHSIKKQIIVSFYVSYVFYLHETARVAS